MARGFGATFGGSTNDIITTALSSNSTLRTWSIWANRHTDGASSGGRCFQKGEIGRTDILNCLGGAGLRYVAGWSTLEGQWDCPTALTVDTWVSVVVTYDSSSAANDPVIYYNAVDQLATRTQGPSGVRDTSSEATTIGNSTSLARCWDGSLAELVAWDRILSSTEISDLADGVSPLRMPSSQVCYIPLIGTRLNDRWLRQPIASGTLVTAHPINPPVFPCL